MVINGKTYEGVMDLANMGEKTFVPNGQYSVFPYRINLVIKSNGKLKQNQGYASN